MGSLSLFCTVILMASSSLPSPFGPNLAHSEHTPSPSFAFGWLDDRDTFLAGDLANIKVKVLGEYKRDNFKSPFNPNITVNGKLGNSSLISGVHLNSNDDPNDWKVSFIPITVGLFNVLITDDNFKVLDSSLHFRVSPGEIYPTACAVSWMDQNNEFAAGTKATFLIHPQDAFGNNVSQHREGPSPLNVTVFMSSENGLVADVLNLTYKGWNEFGFLIFEFSVALSGNILLHVEDINQSLNGSPLPFKVNPGALDIPSCEANWTVNTNFFQLFSKMEFFVNQRDPYGNLVPGSYKFDVEVIELGTNLFMPISDLSSKEVAPGIQLFSFSLYESGNYSLMVFDTEQNKSIANMPYNFTVFIGYCDSTNSIVNGSGLNDSVAGEASKFSILLKDAYEYPAPVDIKVLRIQIVRESDLHHVGANIYASQTNNGTLPIEAPSPSPSDNSTVNREIRASSFDVIYTSKKSGTYEITVFCGNIQLNMGHPLKKNVSAGVINIHQSGVVKFADKVTRMTKIEIVVQLLDSFLNPVFLQQSKLKLEIASVNKSGYSTWPFVNVGDGLYTGFYLAKDTGNYEICVKFEGKPLHPCPFGVNVYNIRSVQAFVATYGSQIRQLEQTLWKQRQDCVQHTLSDLTMRELLLLGEYFPKANNDTISVWEDKSIAFDTLGNDFFAGENVTILEYSEPGQGSLLQYGQLFRYTPYKGYAGNDSFSYTIADLNSNLASASVYISVLSIPPQFISFPSHLHALEDVISPRFGGFGGIKIINSDATANISVTLVAHSGDIFLSPVPVLFWHPKWGGLSVNKSDGENRSLLLSGRSEVINFALQSIQYLGNENFSGDDVIHVSIMNSNGINYLDIPIIVEPVNDPPFIKAPDFIVLEKKNTEDGLMVFDRQKDKFDFFIGDPDLPNFPGNNSNFLTMFSVEVSSGFLSTTLPSELISSTELKLKNSYQWQPLLTFVTISHHFTVKAKGIRFRGTVKECNRIMQQLSYHGEDYSAVLKLKVSDMGNYGCYPDCTKDMSASLFAEANVHLIKRRPMSSLVTNAMGSAIVVESILVFSLGILLLLFTCKCAIVLFNEKKSHAPQDIELSQMQSSSPRTSSEDLSENTTNCSGRYSTLLLNNQPSKLPPRPLNYQTECGESSKHTRYSTSRSSSSDYDQDKTPLPRLKPFASSNNF